MLSEYPLEVPERVTSPDSDQDDAEGESLAQVLYGAMAWMRSVLLGIRGETELSRAPVTLCFIEESDRDLPANAVWERAEGVRATAGQCQVLLCTASPSLAEAFDVRDVLHVETKDGASFIKTAA